MKNKIKIKKLIPLLSGLAGVAMIFSVVYPMVSYEIFGNRKFITFLSPIPEGEPLLADLSQASNWFDNDPNNDKNSSFNEASVSYYTLSIPKLGITSATVALGGDDLSKSLIQYPGTALPGRLGNAVVFGHSILPQFFDPKNYMSIFSTLPTIKKGDAITANYDGVTYNYVVDTMFEVKPDQLEVLNQETSDSYMTLVTCVPPGHPLRPKRLVVRAKIKPYELTRS
jgi:sortase A